MEEVSDLSEWQAAFHTITLSLRLIIFNLENETRLDFTSSFTTDLTYTETGDLLNAKDKNTQLSVLWTLLPAWVSIL